MKKLFFLSLMLLLTTPVMFATEANMDPPQNMNSDEALKSMSSVDIQAETLLMNQMKQRVSVDSLNVNSQFLPENEKSTLTVNKTKIWKSEIKSTDLGLKVKEEKAVNTERGLEDELPEETVSLATQKNNCAETNVYIRGAIMLSKWPNSALS